MRAEWCERYDQFGRATREGPYRESHPDGSLRAEGRYKASQLEGPIVAYHENGNVFLKGFLANGKWQGRWTLHHSTGAPWIEAELSEGRLNGAVRTRHPDGGLAGETRFQHGREDGLARSFYPTKIGGGLLSEVRVEADEWIGTHRVFAANGDALLPIDFDDPIFATVPIELMGSAPRPVGVGIAGSMSISPVTSPAALATQTE